LLPCLLTLSEAGYIALVRLRAVSGVRPVLSFLGLMTFLFGIYALAYMAIRRTKSGGGGVLSLIFFGALLFRVTLLPAGLVHDDGFAGYQEALRSDLRGESVSYHQFLLFDTDIWRYLWDGHVWAHGLNPYQFPPNHPAVDALADQDNPELTDRRAVWEDIRDNVNHPWLPTVYPPLMQLVFRFSHWLAPGSVLVLKALLAGFDLVAVLFIALTLQRIGKPVEGVLLYAWNPLVIKVIAGSGHADVLVGVLLAACAYFLVREAKFAAALSFGLAVLGKFTPLVLLPFLIKRIGWKWSGISAAVIVSGCLPFLHGHAAMFNGFRAFAGTWVFNAGWFAAISFLAKFFSSSPDLVARLVSALVYVAVLGWLVKRDDGRPESFAAAGGAALALLIVLSPTVMPWYLVWVLPLATSAGAMEWIYFSFLVCAAFLVMIRGVEYPWALALEYGAFAAWAIWRMRRKDQSVNAVHAFDGHAIPSKE
jgi:alpha-1,6-mannosyltransferase